MSRRIVKRPLPIILDRPLTRAECVDGPRPCRVVSCRYHLAVEVVRRKVIEQERDITELAHTCALDAAAEGEHTSEQVGALLGVSRQFVDIISERAFTKLAGLSITFDLLGGWQHGEAIANDDVDDVFSTKFSADVRRAFKRVVLRGKSEGLAAKKERKAG